jgi:hypothetical protein
MPLLDKVKDLLSAERPGKYGFSRDLNLVAAAEAHIVWKARLGHHIRGTVRESLDSTPLGQDGICQLGSWIRGSVLAPFCEPELHTQLSEAHHDFHHVGDLIIERLKAGDRIGAETLFIDEYTPALRRIIHALTVINKQLQHD